MLQWFTAAAAGTLRVWQWQQTAAEERRYKSELRGRRQMRSLCRKNLRCLAFSCLAHRSCVRCCCVMALQRYTAALSHSQPNLFFACVLPSVAPHWLVSLTVSSDFSFVSGKLQHLSLCRCPFLPWEPFLHLTDCGFCFWQLVPVMTRWNGILLRVHCEDAGAAQLSKHSMAYPLETRPFI